MCNITALNPLVSMKILIFVSMSTYRKYKYLTHNYRDFTHAGNISKNFNERIMDDMGFQNAGIRQTHFHNKVAGFFATLAGVAVFPFHIHKGDFVVLQYPVKKYFAWLCHVAHWRGAKVIALVHDLGCCRRMKLTPEKEIRRLSNSDCLIIPNANMKRWLEEHGYKGGLVLHHMSDYIADADAPVRKAPAGKVKVLYAGSLPRKKNAFLYALAEGRMGYDLELYGRGFDAEAVNNDNVHYHGFAKDTDLISSVDCNYGLVWDGDSVDACQGPYGSYLKLNNPIKTSLYVRCHLPVIVWEQAAIADVVKEKGIGILVKSLRNLDDTLAEVTAEQYEQMEKNVVEWSKALRHGHCTRQAIIESLAYLGDKFS